MSLYMTIRKFAKLLFVTYNFAASAFPNVLITFFIFLTLPVTTSVARLGSKLPMGLLFVRSLLFFFCFGLVMIIELIAFLE